MQSVFSLGSLIVWFFVGLIAGFLASGVIRGGGYGLIGDIVVGIIGAFLGGLLAGLLGIGGSYGLIGRIVIAFIGACIFIGGLRFFSKFARRSEGHLEHPSEKLRVSSQQTVSSEQKKGSPPPLQGHPSSSTHFSPPTLSIFVSHSSKDDDFGLRLVQDLRKAFGSPDAVWYDSEGGLYGGDSWWSRIVSVLGTCDVFIIVLSPNSMNSKWVMRELDIAMVESKRIVPVLYRQCDIRPDLRAIQTISFLEPISYGTAFNKLLQALRH